MKTEDILAYEAEIRAMREAMATYDVVFDFDDSGIGEAQGAACNDGPRVPMGPSLTGSGLAGARDPSARP